MNAATRTGSKATRERSDRDSPDKNVGFGSHKALASFYPAMFGGGGGLNPRKMQQMMKQMGIDIEEVDAEEIIIRTGEGELVFRDAEVQRMDAQGQATYTITGEPETRAASEEAIPLGEGEETGDAGGADGILDSDVGIVAQRTGASEDDAREALEAENGDLAAAVSRLE